MSRRFLRDVGECARPGPPAKLIDYSPALKTRLLDEELAKIQCDLPGEIDRKAAATLREARRVAEQMIVHAPLADSGLANAEYLVHHASAE